MTDQQPKLPRKPKIGDFVQFQGVWTKSEVTERYDKACFDYYRAAFEICREALEFYAKGDHCIISEESAWDTVSGEPQNFICDEAGTATIEDGSIAKQALALVEESER